MSRAKAAPPASAEAGLRLEITGGGLTTANVRGAEEPPPGAGVTTVTLTLAACATSAVVIAVVSNPLLTYVVARGAPFHQMIEVRTKPLPFTASVKAEAPAGMEAGLRLVRVGSDALTCTETVLVMTASPL